METTNAAEIRFYAELNDFLPLERRQRDVHYPFHVAPSVKDAIEALGVPHTEVDLILANGVPVDFRYRLADGDRISVYPVFEALDVSGLSRLRPEPLRQIRFVADSHLGTLARYLRLLGFDTRFRTDWTDEELATISVNERRVLLTRDRGLLMRRVVTHGLCIRADDPTEQSIEVVRRLHLLGQIRPFSRCMACNGVIEPVDKSVVAERLEPRTLRQVDDFSVCRDCGRVYWEGSHHRRLLGIVARVRQQAGSPGAPGRGSP